MATTVRMIFTLSDEITPELFGEKVMRALCAQCVLRLGEYMVIPNVAVFTVEGVTEVSEYSRLIAVKQSLANEEQPGD